MRKIVSVERNYGVRKEIAFKMYCLVPGAPNPYLRPKARTFIPIKSGPISKQRKKKWALLQFLLKKVTNAIII